MARKIQLLAFGNALVDIELTIGYDELLAIGLQKGCMTLVDHASQQKLLHTLITHHPARLSSGGSAANTIVAFEQFGGEAGYISALGADDYGSFFAREFEQIGIELFAHSIRSIPTGTCLVLVTPDGERTMQTSLGASDAFERSMLEPIWFNWTEWFFVEGYKLTSQQGAETVDESIFLAQKKNVYCALSLSDAFVAITCRNLVEDLLRKIDILFCNEREACAFLETEDHLEAYHALCALVPNLVFTRGPHGSILCVRGQEVTIPAYPTTVLDTTGAGDMYAGALLYGLLHGWNLEDAGHFASRAAAQICAQYGARYKGSYKELIAISSPTGEALSRS